MELLPEPVAAGKSFFSDREQREGEILLVYDFGGGTFDTALLKMERDGLQLLGEPMGMDWGGIAFDRMLYRNIVGKLPKNKEIEEAVKRPKFQWMIMEQTVEIKHLLSSCDSATVNIPIGFGDFIECHVSREEFIHMISARVGESMDIVKMMLAKTGMDIKAVDKILCVGGTARIPYITEQLELLAGKTVLKSVDPELAVCCGAALGGRVEVRGEVKTAKTAGVVKALDDAAAPGAAGILNGAAAPGAVGILNGAETPGAARAMESPEISEANKAEAISDVVEAVHFQGDDNAREVPEDVPIPEGMTAFEADLARNYKDAPAWYKKEAVHDEKAAWFNLGNLYRLGDGVHVDYMKAAKWLKKAAAAGDVQSQRILGRIYDLGGHGIAQNYQKAMYWYKKGALLGDGVCQNNVGKMYEKGQGVKTDYKEALWWYRKAEKQNQETALLNLGNMYRTGRGVAKDYAEAVRCYEKSAKAGCLDAFCNLGWIYEQGGNGIEQDYLKAFYYYKKGAQQGNAICQNNLGNLYEHGHGVHKSKENAKIWYQKAEDNGYKKAQDSLRRLQNAAK